MQFCPGLPSYFDRCLVLLHALRRALPPDSYDVSHADPPQVWSGPNGVRKSNPIQPAGFLITVSKEALRYPSVAFPGVYIVHRYIATPGLSFPGENR